MSRRHAIAIVGLAGRFPGARNVAEFWANLVAGVESVRRFSRDELLAEGHEAATIDAPDYVPAKGALDDIERFDARFFGFTPREAECLDPQHRIFLEECATALEHAGYDADAFEGAIGLFAGSSLSRYMVRLLANRELVSNVGAFQILLSNDKDHLPTRVAYKLNLRGPCITVQSACSTSLTAVHLACQSLLTHECEMALAGGVSVSLPARAGYRYQAGGVLSPDGHCRAFDAAAAGTVPGNGAGVVVLRRLEDALAAGDTIHAVIRGSAATNDGAGRVGYTAPGLQGQTDAIRSALAFADVDPRAVQFVEAHGSGTPLGDPIEAAALTQAFGAAGDQAPWCALGAVKTNIGHLDAAAGIAGLIKVVLALKHGRIPPTVHQQTPNPRIDFARSPFYVNREAIEWPQAATPRCAGVSSFGLGGTNVHLVVEQAPTDEADDSGEPGRRWHAVLLSAQTASALDAATANLARALGGTNEVSLADVARTLQIGRKTWLFRRLIVAESAAQASEALGTPAAWTTTRAPAQPPSVAFRFPASASTTPE